MIISSPMKATDSNPAALKNLQPYSADTPATDVFLPFIIILLSINIHLSNTDVPINTTLQ